MTMTTLTNNEKTIDLVLSNDVKILGSKRYVVTLPEIICSELDDADYIQKEVNAFVSDLSRKLVIK